ncbi:MAG: hypothetical protein KDE17_01170, partial [Rhodobacteraceae bacterium]|nr:hypothetical protein [Paracoccaceae bacterium]
MPVPPGQRQFAGPDAGTKTAARAGRPFIVIVPYQPAASIPCSRASCFIRAWSFSKARTSIWR